MIGVVKDMRSRGLDRCNYVGRPASRTERPRHFRMLLVTIFAAVALALTGAGIFAMMN